MRAAGWPEQRAQPLGLDFDLGAAAAVQHREQVVAPDAAHARAAVAVADAGQRADLLAEGSTSASSTSQTLMPWALKPSR